MKKRFDKYTGKSGSFRRNALIMSSGAMVNVFISLILYPIVTRLFSKEDFGAYGLYVAIVSLIALAGTSLYPVGLVIPKLKREFYALLKLCLTLMTIFVALTGIVIVFFKPLFLYMFKAHPIKSWLYLIPIGVLLYCLRFIFINWNVREKLFKHNASSNVLFSASQKGLNIGYALSLGPSGIGLILSNLISVFVAIYTLGLRKMLRNIGILSRISWKETKEVGLKYKKYPLNLLPGNLINKYSGDLPIYLLTVYFNPALTGAFVLANQIMNIPLEVLGNSLSSVFFQKSNELYLHDPKEMSSFAERTNRKMLLIGVLAFGFLFGFGDIVFAIAFGKEWTVAGQMAAILSLYFIVKLISGPMARVFIVVGKEQYALYASIVLAVCRTIGIYFGVMTGDVMTAIWYFTIGNLIGYLYTTILVFKACNLPVIKLLLEVVIIILLGFSFFHLSRYGFDNVFDVSTWLE